MSATAPSAVDRFVSDPDADGPEALPRSNGELTFESPWESRAFGLAVTLGQRGVFEWEDFRQGLIAEIAAWEDSHPDSEGRADDEDWSYYERWLASLERLLLEHETLSEEEIRHRMERIADQEAHEHDHPDGDHGHGSNPTAIEEVT